MGPLHDTNAFNRSNQHDSNPGYQKFVLIPRLNPKISGPKFIGQAWIKYPSLDELTVVQERVTWLQPMDTKGGYI